MSRILLGRNMLVRFSYAKVFEPYAMNGGDPKYSVSILIDKKDKTSLSAINSGIKEAIEAGKQRFGANFKPSKSKLPIHDGDEEKPEDDVYAGCFYINAKNKNKPNIVNKNKQPIIDDEEAFYSGCFGRVTIEIYPYHHQDSGSKGVAASLGNIMKVKDGDRLGGGFVSADSDFEEFEAIEDEGDTEINFGSDDDEITF